MSPSSLNRLLDRLEAKRFVKRSKDPADRRRTLVELRTRARKVAHLLNFYDEINAVLLEGMTKREGVQFVALLDKAIANTEKALFEEA